MKNDEAVAETTRSAMLNWLRKTRNAGGLNTWGHVRMLFASDRLRGDRNGSSVAMSGNTAVVGAPGDDSNQGSAYIFTY